MFHHLADSMELLVTTSEAGNHGNGKNIPRPCIYFKGGRPIALNIRPIWLGRVAICICTN